MHRDKGLSRLQQKNRANIMAAALQVFSQHGFQGATLDQIAAAAAMSKPNLIYYFPTKEAIFITLLNQLIDVWLAPLAAIDPQGDPLEEICTYIRRKVQMSRDHPRESRLFAHEIVRGAPRMREQLSTILVDHFETAKALLQRWMDQGKLARFDPMHLIFSIWATTQHYADFEAQIRLLADPEADILADAEAHLLAFYAKALAPSETAPAKGRSHPPSTGSGSGR